MREKLDERELIEYLLEQGRFVKTRVIARKLGESTHRIGGMLGKLRKQGAVELISQRRWELNKVVMRRIIDNTGCLECDICTYGTKKGCVEG